MLNVHARAAVAAIGSIGSCAVQGGLRPGRADACAPVAALYAWSVSGDLLRFPGGVEARIHVTGGESGGAFALLTDVAPPGWRLPPHRHANESETIHITRGALWLEVEGIRSELRAGDTAFVPQGALHAGGTLGDERVERVVVFSPAGLERFFIALSAASDPSAMLDLATAHGWRFS